MTRSLFLLRHGKAEWDAPGGGGDHDRPLKPRGRGDAACAGRLLSDAGEEPDLVLASSAVRARTTAELAREAGGWSSPLEVVAELYGASPEDVLEHLRHLDPALERILVVGHEPTMSHTVALLTGGAPPAFPTGTLARIDLAEWSSLEPGGGDLAWLIPPRALGEGGGAGPL